MVAMNSVTACWPYHRGSEWISDANMIPVWRRAEIPTIGAFPHCGVGRPQILSYPTDIVIVGASPAYSLVI